MNIDELKQVGEILAQLSGDAFDGYLLWIGLQVFESTAGHLFGVFLVVLGFKLLKGMISRKDDLVAVNRMRVELGLTRVDWYCAASECDDAIRRIKELKNEKNI